MSDRTPISTPRRILRGLLLILIGIVYGFYANFYHWWVADRIFQVHVAFEAVLSDLRRPWYLSLEPSDTNLEIFDGDALARQDWF